jgi:hypothetical protein
MAESGQLINGDLAESGQFFKNKRPAYILLAFFDYAIFGGLPGFRRFVLNFATSDFGISQE